MLKIRNPDDDQIIESRFSKKSKGMCAVEGCGEILTPFSGPGQDKLCREHQLMLREYGGPARLDRPWTFHKQNVCSCCGKTFEDIVDLFKIDISVFDDVMLSRLSRSFFVGDHITRQSDGGNHSSKNIQTLCIVCNNVKTIASDDWRKGE